MRLQINFFDAVVLLGQTMHTRPDCRGEMLQTLKDATHPTCVYYRLFEAVTEWWAPLNVIEIGTYVGTSAAHFAAHNTVTLGNTKLFGTVITIDINPDAKRCVSEIPLSNIRAITSNSLDENLLEQLGREPKVDILYIDGLHNFSQAYREYYHYRSFVREGGIIFIDDAGLPMAGDEMNVLWEAIPERKQRIDSLHPNVGFGIVERVDMPVATPQSAIDKWNSAIEKRRGVVR